jgi:hypothetical protein
VDGVIRRIEYWLVVAYILCMTLILLPVGNWMFDATPVLVSLKRT